MATLALRFPVSSKFVCSTPPRSNRSAFPPTTEEGGLPCSARRLASSLLRQPMLTPQGEALMALLRRGLPPPFISLCASRHLELLASSAPHCTDSHEYQHFHRQNVGLKAQEAHKEALQEILFLLVASKLLHAMLASLDLHGDTMHHGHAHQQDTPLAMRTPHLDVMLQALHAPDVQPLTSRHVSMVINGANRIDDPVEPDTFTQLRTFELGRMYAASVMHGYFLARVHQRFRLEQRFLEAEVVHVQAYSEALNATKSEATVSMEAYMERQEFQDDGRIHHLRTLRCPLTLNVIEHHCEAMFGSLPKLQHAKTAAKPAVDDTINIQLGLVRTLIYQALAFGALLWDMENRFVPLFFPLSLEED